MSYDAIAQALEEIEREEREKAENLVAPETCSRCSRSIGPKETAYLWHGEPAPKFNRRTKAGKLAAAEWIKAHPPVDLIVCEMCHRWCQWRYSSKPSQITYADMLKAIASRVSANLSTPEWLNGFSALKEHERRCAEYELVNKEVERIIAHVKIAQASGAKEFNSTIHGLSNYQNSLVRRELRKRGYDAALNNEHRKLLPPLPPIEADLEIERMASKDPELRAYLNEEKEAERKAKRNAARQRRRYDPDGEWNDLSDEEVAEKIEEEKEGLKLWRRRRK
jgi:hypothetical protein